MAWSLLRCCCVLVVLAVAPSFAQFYQGFRRPSRQDVDVKIYEFADPFQDEYVRRPAVSNNRFGASDEGFGGASTYSKMQGGGSYGGGFNRIPNQNFGDKNNPVFEFFKPSGVGISLPGQF